MKKWSLLLLSAIALGFFLLYEAQLNHVFEARLSFHLAEDYTVHLAPGDTVSLVIPVSNNSHKALAVLEANGSCRVMHVDYPATMARKGGGYMTIDLVAPTQAGSYTETVVLRADTKTVFHGFTLAYSVAPEHPPVETLWIGDEVLRPDTFHN